ncbi:hypothetical protein [Arcobacter sp. FWKO B]|uniref:hypothetical protein n=1 Tax=Arcobacter sp. FWKO B TaxID=2593672 RepID=UPI0018A4B326|nr:hypothetical protein [Arcobacter sp. FWKO B]QOG12265.1 hypothetical protein FWKOB_05910 [Arcobacter sp. FWKO B]
MFKKILIALASVVAIIVVYGTFFKEKVYTGQEAKEVAKYSELKALQKAIAYRLKYHELETNGASKEEKFELLKDWLLPKPNYKKAKHAYINAKNEHMYLSETTNAKGEKEPYFKSGNGPVAITTYFEEIGYHPVGGEGYNLSHKLDKLDLQRLRFALFHLNVALLPYNGDSKAVKAENVAPLPITDVDRLYNMGLNIEGYNSAGAKTPQTTLDKFLDNPLKDGINNINYGFAIGFEKASYGARRSFQHILEPLDNIYKGYEDMKQFERKRNIQRSDDYYTIKPYTIAEIKEYGRHISYFQTMRSAAERNYNIEGSKDSKYKIKDAFLDRNVYKGIDFKFNDMFDGYGFAFEEDFISDLREKGLNVKNGPFVLNDVEHFMGYVSEDYYRALKENTQEPHILKDLARMEQYCKTLTKREIHLYLESLYLDTIAMPHKTAMREQVAAHNRWVTEDDKRTRAYGKNRQQRIKEIFNSFEFSKTPEAKDWHEAFDYWDELWRIKGLDKPFDRIASFSGHLV